MHTGIVKRYPGLFTHEKMDWIAGYLNRLQQFFQLFLCLHFSHILEAAFRMSITKDPYQLAVYHLYIAIRRIEMIIPNPIFRAFAQNISICDTYQILIFLTETPLFSSWFCLRSEERRV